jgi:hypothetical protein
VNVELKIVLKVAVSGSRFETGTSQILIRNSNHLTASVITTNYVGILIRLTTCHSVSR